MEDVRIRTARPQDAPGLALLMGHLGYPTTPGQMAARLERFLPGPDYRTLVAEAGGGLVGMVGVFTAAGPTATTRPTPASSPWWWTRRAAGAAWARR